MKFTIPTRIAEILFAVAFAVFGILHLKYTAGYKGGVPSFMPGDASIWVYITGICFILAAVAIIIAIAIVGIVLFITIRKRP